jgi:glycosyltransferase involved in cell wall biosynthesis
MIKINNKHQTLFGIANLMLRQKKYEDAIGVYEFLSEFFPDFIFYKINENYARKQLLSAYPDLEQAKSRYHFESASVYQKLLRIANIISNLNNQDFVKLCFSSFDVKTDSQYLLALANASISKDYNQWMGFVNNYLNANNIFSISLKNRNEWIGNYPFLNLEQSDLPKINGPLVTVCMSCFNAEKYAEFAINSILKQSYQNIEFLLFDDKSTDNTLKILKDISRKDTRIKLIANSINQGTYITRNQALQCAKGEFFTILDADDFALPERLSIQVNHLLTNPNHIGVLTEWVRMNEDGRFHFKKWWGGRYQHEAVATLIFRTNIVKEKIGFWDSVRFAADTEFMLRMRNVFGIEAVPLLKIPTEISLFHKDSLTNNPVTGIINGLSPIRQQYRDSWMKWHKVNKDNLFMPFPLKNRKFEVPQEMIYKYSD